MCGAQMIGPPQTDIACDACLDTPRPWTRGHAALKYEGTARKLALALKHGDRTEIAGPAGKWMANAISDYVTPDQHVIPVPLHWRRTTGRKYNQSALLAVELAKNLNLACFPLALSRTVATQALENVTKDERFTRLKGTISARSPDIISGKKIVLVDDVMTSGATLSACTEACKQAGAKEISVVVLARATKTH